MTKMCGVCKKRPLAIYGKCKVCFFTGSDDGEEETDEDSAEDDDVVSAIEVAESVDADTTPIPDLGVRDSVCEALADAGYETVGDLLDASRTELSGVSGIRSSRAASLLALASEHVAGKQRLAEMEAVLSDKDEDGEVLRGESLGMVDLRGVTCYNSDCSEPAAFWVWYRLSDGGRLKNRPCCRHHYAVKFCTASEGGRNHLVDLGLTKVDYFSRYNGQ